MRNTLPFLSAALLACVAVPAVAQGTIRPGQTVRGELAASDGTLDDGSFFDVWRFRAQAGHVYAVTLRSDAFDAFLSVGSSAGPDCEDCEADDDGAGGTDSEVLIRASANGMLEIRANSLMAEETGAYTLALEDRGENAQIDEEDEDEYAGVDEEPVADVGDEMEAMEIVGTPTPVRLDRAAQGELGEDDAQAADDSFYDLFSYRGRAGETITITLRSEDFDAFLSVGRRVDGRFEVMESNDDGEEGTDSELTITLPEAGEYLIRANSLFPEETGAYTLQITRG
jgi:hypothetical protein